VRTLLSISWDASTRALLTLAHRCKSFSALTVTRLNLLLKPCHPRIWCCLPRFLMKTGLRHFPRESQEEVVSSFSSSLGRICVVVIEPRWLVQVSHPSDSLHELSQAMSVNRMPAVPRLKQHVPLIGTEIQSFHQLVGCSGGAHVQAASLLRPMQHYIEPCQGRLHWFVRWGREVLVVHYGPRRCFYLQGRIFSTKQQNDQHDVIYVHILAACNLAIGTSPCWRRCGSTSRIINRAVPVNCIATAGPCFSGPMSVAMAHNMRC
jgi:hypothetical protein